MNITVFQDFSSRIFEKKREKKEFFLKKPAFAY